MERIGAALDLSELSGGCNPSNHTSRMQRAVSGKSSIRATGMDISDDAIRLQPGYFNDRVRSDQCDVYQQRGVLNQTDVQWIQTQIHFLKYTYKHHLDTLFVACIMLVTKVSVNIGIQYIAIACGTEWLRQSATQSVSQSVSHSLLTLTNYCVCRCWMIFHVRCTCGSKHFRKLNKKMYVIHDCIPSGSN
jgi:hypothetical protein